MNDNKLCKKELRDIFNEAEDLFKKDIKITNENCIPETKRIPIENKQHWKKIREVVCVYVDMKNSTKLSISTDMKFLAKVYMLFTGSITKIFHEFDSRYIDIKGDGIFGLFNFNEPHRALAAAVTIQTFLNDIFLPKVEKRGVGYHIGIDVRDVLVRKVGLKFYNDRTDRQNEVWAGKPINMAAKLSSLSDNDILVSEKYFKKIMHCKEAIYSCGCPYDKVEDLWEIIDVSFCEFLDFDTSYRLKSSWCNSHGLEFCKRILECD